MSSFNYKAVVEVLDLREHLLTYVCVDHLLVVHEYTVNKHL